jgi:ABC-2 type transport system ATP-binding protein
VALAVALGRRPELLLLDEPLSELDPLARRQVMGTVLAEAAETGMTVLLSSHVLADLEESCDHLVLLREGRVRLSGGIDALLAAHHVVTGPASPAGLGAGVIHQSTAGRQTTALVRAAEPPQGFRADPATLDALVLAYLQQTMPDDRGRAA